MKTDNKFIDIKIKAKMKNLIILIDNSYDGNILKENGKLKSIKPYSTDHGIGISSLEKTLINITEY